MFGIAERLKQCYAAYRQAIRKLPDTAFKSVGSKYIYIVFLIKHMRLQICLISDM